MQCIQLLCHIMAEKYDVIIIIIIIIIMTASVV
jgi:hypothetical protein